jgi:hypothetical protein
MDMPPLVPTCPKDAGVACFCIGIVEANCLDSPIKNRTAEANAYDGECESKQIIEPDCRLG